MRSSLLVLNLQPYNPLGLFINVNFKEQLFSLCSLRMCVAWNKIFQNIPTSPNEWIDCQKQECDCGFSTTSKVFRATSLPSTHVTSCQRVITSTNTGFVRQQCRTLYIVPVSYLYDSYFWTLIIWNTVHLLK